MYPSPSAPVEIVVRALGERGRGEGRGGRGEGEGREGGERGREEKGGNRREGKVKKVKKE